MITDKERPQSAMGDRRYLYPHAWPATVDVPLNADFRSAVAPPAGNHRHAVVRAVIATPCASPSCGANSVRASPGTPQTGPMAWSYPAGIASSHRG